MIEIAKLVAGAKLNAPSPPVEPARAPSGTGEERKTAETEGQAQRVISRSSQGVAVAESQGPVEKEKQDKVDTKTFDAALNKANDQLSSLDTSLRFEVNKETDRVIVRLVQSDTGEVIRQYPPEEIVKLSERLEKALKDMQHGDESAILGMLVDRKH